MQPQIKIVDVSIDEVSNRDSIYLAKRQVLEEVHAKVTKMINEDQEFGVYSLFRIQGMIDNKILKLILDEV